MAIQTVLNHSLTQALGQALLAFLWQGALIALVLGAFQTMARGAGLRHAAACAAMLAMPATFLATALQRSLAPALAIGAPPDHLAPLSGLATPSGLALPILTAAPRVTQSLDVSGWAVCVWLAGVLALSIYTLAGWLRVRRLHRQPSETVNPAWIETLESLKARLRVSRTVRLCATLAGEVPAVIGFFRPVILLPLSAISGLDELQLRAILAHELAHIRRHDYLINLLQAAIETLLFYHPLVWWVGRQIRRERENCADDLAVAACGDAVAYAGALVRLEELRGAFPHPALFSHAPLAATGGDLLERIRRLTGQPRRQPVPRPLGAVAAAAVVLIAALIAFGPMLREVDAAPQNPAPAPVPVAPAPAPAPQKPPAQPRAPQPAPVPSASSKPHAIRDDIGVEIQRDVAAMDDRLRYQFDDLNQAIAQLNQGQAQLSQSEAQLKVSQAQLIQSQMELKRGQAATIASQANSGESGRSVDLLLNLFDKYENGGDLVDARAVLGYLASSHNPKAIVKVLSVARSDAHVDLRRAAVGLVSSLGSSYDTLVSLYDQEKDADLKRMILGQIASLSDARVEDKLASIAQSDASPDLRRIAIGLLAGR